MLFSESSVSLKEQAASFNSAAPSKSPIVRRRRQGFDEGRTACGQMLSLSCSSLSDGCFDVEDLRNALFADILRSCCDLPPLQISGQSDG